MNERISQQIICRPNTNTKQLPLIIILVSDLGMQIISGLRLRYVVKKYTVHELAK